MANLQEPQHVNGTLDLRKIDDIPEPYRSIFSDYPHFNVIQSAVFNDIFYSGKIIHSNNCKTLVMTLFYLLV